jgi:hypothetical protein
VYDDMWGGELQFVEGDARSEPSCPVIPVISARFTGSF